VTVACLLGALALGGCARYLGAATEAPVIGQAPSLSLVVAVSNDRATTPPSLSDLRVVAGSPIVIKWRATDDAPLPDGPIDLEVTRDGTSFSPVASAVPNAAGSGCTVDASRTGCYRWVAPGGYVKLRVTLRDADGNRVRVVSPPLNASPPLVSAVVAASVDQPPVPLGATDVTVAAGGTVFIKWRASDDLPLPAAPVSLSYTTDEKRFLPIATGLANAAATGCTLSGSQTGCAVWKGGAPSGYFRVRVAVQDVDGMINAASSLPFNVSPPLRFLAGNTDPGTDVSALAGVFLSDTSDGATPDAAELVVLPSGVVYFRDLARGVLKIDPADGVVRVLVPYAADSTGDGGPAAQATVRAVYRMALDHQGRVLLHDRDRIRRIDATKTPETIETVVGGGTRTDDGAGPLEVQIDLGDIWLRPAKALVLFALPNGDLYFQSDSVQQSGKQGARIRRLRAATGKVESLRVTGQGDGFSATQALDECALQHLGVVYDPASSQLQAMVAELLHNDENTPLCPGVWEYGWARLAPATGAAQGPHPDEPGHAAWGGNVPIQGLDGKLYLVARVENRVFRFDPAGNQWTPVLGSGTKGTCADGTSALACDVDLVDLFVDAGGRMTFLDRGQIRTVDGAGKVSTVMGQALHFGDGGDALAARFGRITSVGLWSAGGKDHLVLLDALALRIRELEPGGTIQTLAGNGASAGLELSVPAAAQGLYLAPDAPSDHLELDGATGDIFFGAEGALVRLVRSSGLWSVLVGGGGWDYFDFKANGRPGAEISVDGYTPQPLGRDGSGLLVCLNQWSTPCRSATNIMANHYALSDGTQAHLAGVPGCPVGELCKDGTPTASCRLPDCGRLHPALRDAATDRWLLLDDWTSTVRTLKAGGSVGTLAELPGPVSAFTYDESRGLLYYCDGERLHRYDVAAAKDTALAWPVPGMACAWRTLIYSESRKSLIFAYTQSGVYGVAEYAVP